MVVEGAVQPKTRRKRRQPSTKDGIENNSIISPTTTTSSPKSPLIDNSPKKRGDGRKRRYHTKNIVFLPIIPGTLPSFLLSQLKLSWFTLKSFLHPLLTNLGINYHRNYTPFSALLRSLRNLKWFFIKPVGTVHLSTLETWWRPVSRDLFPNYWFNISNLTEVYRNRSSNKFYLIETKGIRWFHNSTYPPFVSITNREDINFIYNSGTFGKGSLSRSYPSTFLVSEHLQLDIYEAVFLSSGLDALKLVFSDGREVNPAELWLHGLFWGATLSKTPLGSTSPQNNSLLSPANSFLINYVAYHYFRSNKWVVKTGLKYSSDFVLYRDGPMYRHSEYAVFVKAVPANFDTEENSFDTDNLSWQELFNLSRLCSQVKKKLLLCYVFHPRHLPPTTSTSSLHCLSHYRVKCVEFQRWCPTRTRE